MENKLIKMYCMSFKDATILQKEGRIGGFGVHSDLTLRAGEGEGSYVVKILENNRRQYHRQNGNDKYKTNFTYRAKKEYIEELKKWQVNKNIIK